MKSRVLIANWKMNSDREQAAEWCRQVAAWLPRGSLTKKGATQVWVAPPFTLIPAVADGASNSPIVLGAQNVHGELSGAFTGEVSVSMLRSFGCQFALVGHSERRHLFGESDDICAERALGAIAQGLSVVFCVGETFNERRAEETNTVIKRQLSALCQRLNSLNQLTIAYEPVWAIGTGLAASPAEIAQAHSFILGYFSEHFQGSAGPPILYGGSVTPENAREIFETSNVAGALIGKASLSPQNIKTFWEISESLW